LTVLFVTHNVQEAVRLADRVILLSNRPARIIAEHVVDVQRPRRTDTGQIAELVAAITADLQGQGAGGDA
jgi:sulfonate transport system ATP-binding protein